MKSIETYYLPATSTKGTRVVATDGDGNRVVVPYSTACSPEDAHQLAARTLCKKMDWQGELIGGHTARGMAWVFVDPRSPRINLSKKEGQ